MLRNRKIIEFPDANGDPQAVRRTTPLAKLSRGERAAMRALGQYIILTPELFGLAAGYGRTEYYGALERLFEKGLADRGFYETERTEREIALALPPKNDELVYKLTSQGWKRGVRDGLFVDGEDTFKIGQEWAGKTPRDIKHRILLSEVMIFLRLGFAADDEREISRLTPDFALRKNRSVNNDHITDKRTFRPDIVSMIEKIYQGKSTLIFWEIENTKLPPTSACKSTATIASKIKPYDDYLVSGHRTIKGATQDMVAYVMNHPAAHLEDAIAAVPWDEVGEVSRLVRLTTFEEMRALGIRKCRWRNHRGELVDVFR